MRRAAKRKTLYVLAIIGQLSRCRLPRLRRRSLDWREGAAAAPLPFGTRVHDRDRITAASRWRHETGCSTRITGAVAQLPAAGGASKPSEFEVSPRHLVRQAQSLQRCSVFRQPLVTDGRQQHHASRLWVAYRGCVDPSLLGSDQPLQGAQRGGHGRKLISLAPKRNSHLRVVGYSRPELRSASARHPPAATPQRHADRRVQMLRSMARGRLAPCRDRICAAPRQRPSRVCILNDVTQLCPRKESPGQRIRG